MQMPEKLMRNNSSLYICEKSTEMADRYVKQISKIKMQVRSDFYKKRTLLTNTGIFKEL